MAAAGLYSLGGHLHGHSFNTDPSLADTVRVAANVAVSSVVLASGVAAAALTTAKQNVSSVASRCANVVSNADNGVFSSLGGAGVGAVAATGLAVVAGLAATAVFTLGLAGLEVGGEMTRYLLTGQFQPEVPHLTLNILNGGADLTFAAAPMAATWGAIKGWCAGFKDAADRILGPAFGA